MTRPSRAADKLLTTALRLFARQGIKPVGINLILDQANGNKDTLYRVFGDKDGLVAATLDHYAQHLPWLQTLRDAAAELQRLQQETTAAGDVAGRAQDRLLAVFDTAATQAATADYQGCFLLTAAIELRNSPNHPARQVIAAHHQQIRDLLHQLATAAGASDPQQLAAWLQRDLYGLLVEPILGQPAPPDAIRQQLQATLAVALGPANPPHP